MARICVYYDATTSNILDIIPHETDDQIKSEISSVWQTVIGRKILQLLSVEESMTISKLASSLNHSVSTIHENVKKLEQKGIIESVISYEGKKQRIIRSKVLFATKSSKFKESLSKFFQGFWVNSKDTTKIIEFLQSNKSKKFSVEQISVGTAIPIHRVEIALSNWDSATTRGVSQFLKEPPFVKEVKYQAK